MNPDNSIKEWKVVEFRSDVGVGKEIMVQKKAYGIGKVWLLDMFCKGIEIFRVSRS
jgi:hypothetical protein